MSDKLTFNNQAWYFWIEHAIVIFGLGYVIKKLCKGGLTKNLTRFSVNAIQNIPGAKGILEKQQQDALKSIESLIFNKDTEDNFVIEEIPEEGISVEKVLEILQSWRDKEEGFKSGKSFGGIYTDYHSVEEVEKKALAMYCDSNGLYPTTFPGLRKVEAEIVRMACNLLHGDAETCGTMTSGGTESILCAMKAYRDRGLKLYGITEPEIIIPESAHAAFIKGAHYFGYKLVYADTGDDWRVDLNEIKKKLNKNTVMVVGSAPSFPQGVIDDIPGIAKLLDNYPQTGLHVDGCLGGFILPWLEQLGHVTKKYAFDIPRVTSISADLHKYAFAPKGASVILWRDSSYRKFQYFSYCDWSGGLYCSPALQGSRAGGPMAGAWAVLVHMGKNGFNESAKHYYKAFTTILEGVRSIDDIYVVGDPDACTIAYASKTLDIYQVGDAMLNRGWTCNRLQKPPCLQLQIGSRSNFDAQGYVDALRESVLDVKTNPQNFKEGMAGVYGVAATLAESSATGPDRKSVV